MGFVAGHSGLPAAAAATRLSVVDGNGSFVCMRRRGKVAATASRSSVRVAAAAPMTCVLAEEVAAAAAATSATSSPAVGERHDVRNIAIVAHVDHGKTTLVDALLAESKVFRANQEVQERIMDSNDLERERGITILAKNTAINYKNTRLNIVDTPGHADFGGEVERVLNMVDGVLLLVDAVEGPKPQTRFVLKKALALGLKVVVVVNKIDRPASRPEWVVDTTFDLFCELGATDEQTDFHTVYASALRGLSGNTPDSLEQSLKPVLDAILDLPKPKVNQTGTLQMMVSNIDYDDFKGRLAIGRIQGGVLRKQQTITIAHPDKEATTGKVSEIMVFDNFGKAVVEEASAGDIVVLSGLSDIEIGDTIVAQGSNNYLEPIEVEEPTVRMAFSINTSEFAGKEGKFVTSRNIRDRLFKELERNVALKVEPTDSADTFEVLGRGALHLTILIETMRREGFELMIGAPTVITKVVDGKKCEPFEEVEIEVQEEYMGAVVELFGRRKGEMLDMGAKNSEGMMTVNFLVPTRGLLGVKNALLTATRGNIVMNTQFAGFKPSVGDIGTKDQGNLVAHETGKVTSFGLEAAQERGRMFCTPGEEVYANQVVGIHQRPGDLKVNICKKKALTNMRAASKDTNTSLQGVLDLSLDDAIEYITGDEIVEVTPLSIRISKRPQIKKKLQ